MKKITLILIITLGTNSLCSQSLDETFDWIARNSNGREAVDYDYEKKKLLFISFRGDSWRSVEEIDPKNIKTIKLKYGSNGWNSVQLHYNLSKDISYSTYFLDSNFNEKPETRKNYKNGKIYIDFNLNVNKEKIKQFKNAFLNIFKKLGINLNDDDEMFKNE